MNRSLSVRFRLFALPLLVAAFAPWLAAQKTATTFPAPGQWQKKSPAAVGMDAAKLQQSSEWEGMLWGKNATFLGLEEFGEGQRNPRAIEEPGSHYEYNDVRINRFSLSLLRLFGKPLPEVLKENIMDPIGASPNWRWMGYNNSKVDINGRQIESVTGGTRWGGGLWINSEDLARFGLLILNHGKWGNRQIVSEQWLNDA